MARIAGKLRISVAYLMEGYLGGVHPALAIHLAARHPELADTIGKDCRRDRDQA